MTNENEFSILNMRVKFGGRHFSKCAGSERKLVFVLVVVLVFQSKGPYYYNKGPTVPFPLPTHDSVVYGEAEITDLFLNIVWREMEIFFMETICLGMEKEVKNVSTILSMILDCAFSSTFGRYSTSGYLHV